VLTDVTFCCLKQEEAAVNVLPMKKNTDEELIISLRSEVDQLKRGLKE
jgi:hypothetical protein